MLCSNPKSLTLDPTGLRINCSQLTEPEQKARVHTVGLWTPSLAVGSYFTHAVVNVNTG